MGPTVGNREEVQWVGKRRHDPVEARVELIIARERLGTINGIDSGADAVLAGEAGVGDVCRHGSSKDLKKEKERKRNTNEKALFLFVLRTSDTVENIKWKAGNGRPINRVQNAYTGSSEHTEKTTGTSLCGYHRPAMELP